MLCPTELLRWRNEPRAPNDTRRAMVSFGAPDRHPEPEPLFGPRSHYPMDGPRVRRPSWFVRRVRHAPFQARRFGARMARRQASGRVRGGTRYRGRAFASAPVAPGGRSRSSCQRAFRMHGHPGPGQQKKPRSGCTPAGAFASGETCGGGFLRGSPDRCPGDLVHEFTVHGPRIGARPRSAFSTVGACRRGRRRTVARPVRSVRFDG